jgi:hypothetical protein
MTCPTYLGELDLTGALGPNGLHGNPGPLTGSNERSPYALSQDGKYLYAYGDVDGWGQSIVRWDFPTLTNPRMIAAWAGFERYLDLLCTPYASDGGDGFDFIASSWRVSGVYEIDWFANLWGDPAIGEETPDTVLWDSLYELHMCLDPVDPTGFYVLAQMLADDVEGTVQGSWTLSRMRFPVDAADAAALSAANEGTDTHPEATVVATGTLPTEDGTNLTQFVNMTATPDGAVWMTRSYIALADVVRVDPTGSVSVIVDSPYPGGPGVFSTGGVGGLYPKVNSHVSTIFADEPFTAGGYGGDIGPDGTVTPDPCFDIGEIPGVFSGVPRPSTVTYTPHCCTIATSLFNGVAGHVWEIRQCNGWLINQIPIVRRPVPG